MRVGSSRIPRRLPSRRFPRSIETAAPGSGKSSRCPSEETDIAAALTSLARQPSGGLIAIPDSFTIQHRDLVIALATRNRVPAVYTNLVSTPVGGLMAYAVDTRDLMQRAATYVDRILKGANPADLPVRQPTKFQLSINLKAAKAIGLDLAPNLIARADEVIE